MTPLLPDDLLEVIAGHLADAWFVDVCSARRVCRAFRDALQTVPAPDRCLKLHMPRLCVHAAHSLERMPPAWPTPEVLGFAMRRQCAFCSKRYSGGFTCFSHKGRFLVVYAHAKCVRRNSIAFYWVESPQTRPSLLHDIDPTLYQVCVREPERIRNLPRHKCHGWNRFYGAYHYDNVFLRSVPGIVPSECAVLL